MFHPGVCLEFIMQFLTFLVLLQNELLIFQGWLSALVNSLPSKINHKDNQSVKIKQKNKDLISSKLIIIFITIKTLQSAVK